jgi:VIT1/CCC1 family predicted Fe2+/Mn2+ transporter
MGDDQQEPAGSSLPEDERSYERTLPRITDSVSAATLARFQGRHHAIGGNALRAGVLGANDGLVSNFSLVMGVAGASAGNTPVVVAGVAGLLAGSLSMALGEWLSVQSSRELYANQIAVEAAALATFPEQEAEKLRHIYETRGLDPADARWLAHRIVTGDPRIALDTLSRDVLGIDPDDLGGSAWVAAFTSFALFAIGAIVPLIPFLVGTGLWAIVAATVMSGVALFALGAAITRMTGRQPIVAGLRQLGFGMAAAAVTFGIGSLLGTSLA